MLIKDMAICIRAVDYSETSQIVTLFAKDNGKLKAIAKGSKRPKSSFDGTIEVLSCGQIVFSGSARQKDSQKLATLTELQQERYFAGLKNSLLNLNCCLFGTELIDNMVQEYDPHPELFDRFLQFVQNESDAQTRREALTLLVLFQLALLRETGLQPVLYACANCKCKVDAAGEKSQWYFSSLANGLICKDCEVSFPDRIKLSEVAVKTFLDLKSFENVGEKTVCEIEKLFIRHFTELLHRRPKMAKYILNG